MMRKMFGWILILVFWAAPVFCQDTIVLNFEDFDDQNIFNNFSGDWNGWARETASFDLTFDTTHQRSSQGACLKVAYSVPSPGYGGLWFSLLGKISFTDQHLDFNDIYGELKNSSGNPVSVTDVGITEFSFWARGSGASGVTHAVKVEFKDADGEKCEKRFSIPDTEAWNPYHFSVSEMTGVDLSRMKEIAFVFSDTLTPHGKGTIYLDDFSFSTTEPVYDARNFSDDQMLDLTAHRAFNYFMTFTDENGLALDRSTFSDLVSVAAIGFQLAAYCIGHQRGWAGPETLESRVAAILTRLSEMSMGPDPGILHSGYKGFFYHFLDAETGKRKNNGVELSLYDTTLLMYGVLCAKACFPGNSVIQTRAARLYDAVEWDWMKDGADGINKHQFYLGWTPENGFVTVHADGYTDEALLVDILALGSSTHPVFMDTYNARTRTQYRDHSGALMVPSWTGSMFTYFFASLWLDLRARGTDLHDELPLNIWENNKRAIFANQRFCMDNTDDQNGDGDDRYTTYGENAWGLTACDNLVRRSRTWRIAEDAEDAPDELLSEYMAFGADPTEQNIKNPQTKAPHVGTLAVYGALSAINHLPARAISALRNYYAIDNLFSPLFGFGDAFSLDPHTYEADLTTYAPVFDSDGNLQITAATWLNGPWVNSMTMGIDKGPVLLAFENYRTGFIWRLLETDAHIQKGLDAVFGRTSAPVPRISANGSQGPVTVHEHDSVTVSIGLDAGDYANLMNAEYWVSAETDYGTFYYALPGGWGFSARPALVFPLISFSGFQGVSRLAAQGGVYV